MAGWSSFEQEAPELASRIRAILGARRHHTLATLRRDGAPRVSGTEVRFEDGELRIGIMPGSRKRADVERDPRFALHALSDDPPEDDQASWGGDAKLSGTLAPAKEPMFTLDISEVALTHLDEAATVLVITSWHPGRGVDVRRRA